MPIKVRVGQSDAIKILSSAGGGSVSAVNAQNVIGGIGSITELDVSGITTLTGQLQTNNINAGIITSTAFKTEDLNVTGLSTFVGVVTTSNDLFVGGDLFIKDDLVLDNVTAGSLNITGITTLASSGGITTTGGDLFVGGDLFIKDDLVLDNVTAGSLTVSGISTFNNDVVFQGAAANQKITFDHSENDLEFTDNARIKFGNNDDLEIWHDGTNSNIKNSTGDFHIRSDSLVLKRADNSERYLKATVNSDVKIYFNGNEKFATTGIGITVLGNTESQTLNITGIGTISSLGVTGTLTAGLIDGGAF